MGQVETIFSIIYIWFALVPTKKGIKPHVAYEAPQLTLSFTREAACLQIGTLISKNVFDNVLHSTSFFLYVLLQCLQLQFNLDGLLF